MPASYICTFCLWQMKTFHCFAALLHAVEAAGALAKVLPREEVANPVMPAVVQCSQDKSWRVRYNAVQQVRCLLRMHVLCQVQRLFGCGMAPHQASIMPVAASPCGSIGG